MDYTFHKYFFVCVLKNTDFGNLGKFREKSSYWIPLLKIVHLQNNQALKYVLNVSEQLSFERST